MKVQIGKGIEMDVDTSRLGLTVTTPVAEHIAYIGLRNVLMDSHSTYTKETENYVEESRAAAERKLEALYNGELRISGQREIDPVKLEAQRFAAAQVKKHLKQMGREVDGKTLRDMAAQLIDKNPSIMKTAKKRVDAAKGAEIDFAGLQI